MPRVIEYRRKDDERAHSDPDLRHLLKKKKPIRLAQITLVKSMGSTSVASARRNDSLSASCEIVPSAAMNTNVATMPSDGQVQTNRAHTKVTGACRIVAYSVTVTELSVRDSDLIVVRAIAHRRLDVNASAAPRDIACTPGRRIMAAPSNPMNSAIQR